MSLVIDVGDRPGPGRDRGISAAAAAIRRGELVVLPTESAYGLAADPFSAKAMRALRAAKGRGDDLPVGVLVGAVRTVDGLASGITADGRALIEAFWPGPLTLVVREQPTLAWDNPGGHVSLRMPLHPVTLAVLTATGPLAVTSAQRAGSVPPRTCAEAESQMGDEIALYLDAGPTTDEVPSSIVDLTAEPPVLLREGAYPLQVLREVSPDLVGPEAPG
ncbi:MAG: L-threonylcarbamoyladenylate synthase [Candidatus Nanopelagicales bacterium]|jgi:L-threonylcarbamoyladenylate synthase